jgi:hypothetical protein
MTTQPAKWPPRIEVYKDPTSTATSFEFEEVAWPGPVEYLSIAEHEALIAEARAECWRDAAIEFDEISYQMQDDDDKALVLEQKRYCEVMSAQYSGARPQSSEPERKA